MPFPTPATRETCTEGSCSDGKGTLTYADGGTYVGQFKNAQFEGLGTRQSFDGSEYVPCGLG